ncbi:MAG: hypothetical protein O9294_08120 [Cytophagales bacterium]|jgi:hypothetical protein|nr:hypothetical protein [Cytophagales bacterium]
MKIPKLLLSITLLISISGCSEDEPDYNEGLVGLSLQLHQNSLPGLEGYLESVEYVTSKGVNIFGMSPEWIELEPSIGTYSLQEFVINPLTLLDPDKTKFKSYILVLKMIDTNRKTLPSDLISKSFDDPVVINRFLSLIDNLASVESIDRISHILIGNEVDGYFTSNPTSLNDFSSFYQQSVNHIHQKMPWVKVGTIITFNSLNTNPIVFNTLTPNSDFICYTYYPTDVSNPNWQMRTPSDVIDDMAIMADKAGDKPFAFTEIGYPSAPSNNSSESLQRLFIENMFDVLRPYKENRKLEFIYYHGLYDYPPDFCEPYAQAQGVDPTYLCGFMNSLGLNHYDTSEPKQSWVSFVDKLKDW